MDFTNLYLVAALAGIVELYSRLVEKDWKTAGVIAVAGLAGALLAPHAPGTDFGWFVGMLYGFSASGVITTVSHLRSSK